MPERKIRKYRFALSVWIRRLDKANPKFLNLRSGIHYSEPVPDSFFDQADAFWIRPNLTLSKLDKALLDKKIFA